MTVAIDEGIGATAPITIDPVSLMLTFVPAEWNAVQTVTVTADQDDDALGGTRTLTHTVTNYPGVTSAANVTVTVSRRRHGRGDHLPGHPPDGHRGRGGDLYGCAQHPTGRDRDGRD